MSLAEHYTNMAAVLRIKARHEQSEQVKSEWESLADCYRLLAEKAAGDSEALDYAPHFVEGVM